MDSTEPMREEEKKFSFYPHKCYVDWFHGNYVEKLKSKRDTPALRNWKQLVNSSVWCFTELRWLHVKVVEVLPV